MKHEDMIKRFCPLRGESCMGKHCMWCRCTTDDYGHELIYWCEIPVAATVERT